MLYAIDANSRVRISASLISKAVYAVRVPNCRPRLRKRVVTDTTSSAVQERKKRNDNLEDVCEALEGVCVCYRRRKCGFRRYL